MRENRIERELEARHAVSASGDRRPKKCLGAQFVQCGVLDHRALVEIRRRRVRAINRPAGENTRQTTDIVEPIGFDRLAV